MNSESWNKIDLFIGTEANPLKNYEQFFQKISFDKYNYSFIVPINLTELFSSFYSKILKDSFTIFPKNFEQNNELINDYENEVGKEKKWILISPCNELEKNIKIYHQKETIICFIGYCPIFNHWHSESFFKLFSKFYGIVDSGDQLIDLLFKLSNVFYYREKQKYELINNNATLELKYETYCLINIKEAAESQVIIQQKLDDLFNYKINKINQYFIFIKSYNFLCKNFEEQNFDILMKSIINMGNFILEPENATKIIPSNFNPDIESEKFLFSLNFLKDLHILYFYFAGYPYILGELSIEEMIQNMSIIKPNMVKYKDIAPIVIPEFNSLMDIISTLSHKVQKGESILGEKDKLKSLHKSMFIINCIFQQMIHNINIHEFIKYYQIKNYCRDIDICLIKFLYYNLYFCKYYPLFSEISDYMNTYEIYINSRFYFLHFKKDSKSYENEQEKIFNESIRYNDTIIIGNKKFHDLIKNIKLPCKNKYFIDDKTEEITKFFETPRKIANKYIICKYFIIMDETIGIKYLETIQYFSNKYFFKKVIILYIQNKSIKIDKEILQAPLLPVILTYSEKDILNYYEDHFERLKEKNIKYIKRMEFLEQKYGLALKFPKIEETKIFKEEDNGWDMKKNLDINLFSLVKIERALGTIRSDIFDRQMYKLYQENNCLDLYLKYYGNYFGSELIVEQSVNNISMSKMFLYAYTLEENNGKSFYCMINNDFRSGDAEKISRYLPNIKLIFDLIRGNYLKSYSGEVYRAAFFKQELINEIKPGKKMFNASFWSSSKKLSVAKQFLFRYQKNILIHSKIKKGNNIDIHLEKLSQYPNEEEILFLPFCTFEIKSISKVKENNKEYYDLELIYCDDENSYNVIENIKEHDFIF